MMSGHIRRGEVVGLGAALPVILGFVPRYVELFNVTDAISQFANFQWVMPFSAGGSNGNVISAGDKIKGATSGAIATVEAVLIASGSFAAGTAAGFLVLQEGSLTGTFGAENVTILSGATAGTTTAAAVTANVTHTTQIIAAGTQTVSTTGIIRLEGVAGASGAGFTISAGVAAAGKLLRYVAYQGE